MEDRIAAIAAMSIDDMRKALADLTQEQLTELRAKEVAGKDRAGAKELIDDALKAFAEPATPPAPPEAPTPPAPETPPASEQPEPSPPIGEAGQSDEAALHRGPFGGSMAAADQRIVLIVPTDRRDLVARVLAALDDGDSLAIVLADEDGEALPIPPIEVRPGDVQRFGGSSPSLIYKPRIELPPELPAVAVRQAFLLVEPRMDDDGPAAAAVCRLSVDLNAGGGRRAEIPDGNLLFALG
jgi:hypothetical protein